ncbi:hypothetical protein JCM10213_005803 [Rhodosporidiobolus nylandii]
MVTFPSLLPRGRTTSTTAVPLPSPRNGTSRDEVELTRFYSGLDFKDASDLPWVSGRAAPASFVVPLTPPASQLLDEAVADDGHEGRLAVPVALYNRSGSASGFSVKSGETIRRQNEGEQRRLQGLMRSDTVASRTVTNGTSAVGHRMNTWERVKSWMVNEGSGRLAFALFVLVQAAAFALGLVNYALKGSSLCYLSLIRPWLTSRFFTVDNLTTARRNFGLTYTIARAAALVLHVDVAFILLPVCRNFISFIRRGPLNSIVPFEKNILFHKAVAWSMVIFTLVHVVAHMFNAWWLSEMGTSSLGPRFVMFLEVNFTTGPFITGWLMTAGLATMAFFAVEKRKRKHFERFWFSHHLFLPFFVAWQLHGMFCLIRPDRPPFCSAAQVGVFWKYWLVGGVLYFFERVLREVRSRHRTWIHKVVLHPSGVVEVQLKKEKMKARAGQYVFLNVPSISYFQFHPFTLTSAPEEDHIAVHIRVVGDWTRAFAEALGCHVPENGEPASKDPAAMQTTFGRALPRVMVDGPFGSASEDVLKYEVSVLVGAGIGVTPFASLLKHIWYRKTFPGGGERLALQKVYFFWICRDYNSFEWFQSLLYALEEQDLNGHIEIHTYMTGRVRESDMHNIIAHDVGGEMDALTRLKAPTHYGRPNWDRIFSSIAASHPDTDVGTFFCGPKTLGSSLHGMCNKYTNSKMCGTRFFWAKENF